MTIDGKVLWWLTGCNGSGKSELAPRILKILNAGRAEPIEYFSPDEGERVPCGWLETKELLEDKVKRRFIPATRSFLVETTVPTAEHEIVTGHFREQGYKIGIIAVGVPYDGIAQANIDARIDKGGHKVMPILRQTSFEECRRNTPSFLALADEAHLFHNNHPRSGQFTEFASRTHSDGFVLHMPRELINDHHHFYFNSILNSLAERRLIAMAPNGRPRRADPGFRL